MAALASMFAPKTGAEMASEMSAAHALLPAELQLGAARVDQGAINEARARYQNDVVRPGVEQMKAQMAAEGRDNSTFGGAALAQMQAEGDRNSYYAGEDLVDRALNRWTQQRNSYFGTKGGEGGLSVNDKGGATMGNFLLGMGRLNQDANDSAYAQMYKERDYNKQNGFMGQYGGVIGGLARGAVNQFGPSVWNWMKGKFPGGGGGAASSGGGGASGGGASGGGMPNISSGLGAPSTGNVFGTNSWNFGDA